MLHRLERKRIRRSTSEDKSTILKNANTSYEKHCCQQLAERVRELEKEIVPDRNFYSVPPTYSPYSALTPCSNASGNGFSNYSRSQNFPMNLFSPNSLVPTQRFGLSFKILDRAHQIPERFWIDWQQKQMQNRIEELEHIKNNLTSPNDIDVSNHRKSFPRSTTQDRIVSPNVDTETSSSSSSSSTTDSHSSFSFDKRSINEIDMLSSKERLTRKSSSTLDRSRLTIFLPFSNTNHQHQPIEKSINLIETISSASSIEDVAQIDTELKLTLLSQENPDQTNPLLYSQGIFNRTIVFRSLRSQ